MTLPGAKIVVVSDEGPDMNAYRIREFKAERADSCMSYRFVNLRTGSTWPETVNVAGDLIHIITRYAARGCRSGRQEITDR